MAEKELSWILDRGRSLVHDPIKDDENKEQVFAQLERNGWRVEGTNEIISLDDIDELDPDNWSKVFYKERIIKKVDAATKMVIDDRIIVTYSLKYKAFMQKKRVKDIQRALKLIASKNSKKINLNTKNDIRVYIKAEHKTKDGENASVSSYVIDENAVAQQARFDGFYAVATSLSKEIMSVSDIIQVNKGRWEIEESFMLMKSEFRSRPVFVRNEDRIKAHFTTCFIALLIFRILEKKVNDISSELMTAQKIIDTLRKMNITKLRADLDYYTGSYKRTDLTDALQQIAGFRTDCELIKGVELKKYLKISRKI